MSASRSKLDLDLAQLEEALTTIGYIKKVEEIRDLLDPKYTLSIWHDLQAYRRSVDDQIRMLDVLRRNLYQLRKLTTIVDALLRKPVTEKATRILMPLRAGPNDKEIIKAQLDLDFGFILEFVARLPPNPRSPGIQEYQSPTMRTWAAHLSNLDSKTKDAVDAWEAELLDGPSDQVTQHTLTMAVAALKPLKRSVREAQLARMNEPFDVFRDDLALLFASASDAEKLCLTLQTLLCGGMNYTGGADLASGRFGALWTPRMPEWIGNPIFKEVYRQRVSMRGAPGTSDK